MKLFASQRFLPIYSGVLILVFAITVVCGFAASRNATFDQISVHRINFVEPDGTPRLIISDRAEFPGAFMRGKEYPRPDRRDAAGMLFMNDEASEMGGLIWAGLKEKDGTIQNHGHLSFDQYEQDQIFSIDSGREDQTSFQRLGSVSAATIRFRRRTTRVCGSINCRRTSRRPSGRSFLPRIRATRTGFTWGVRRISQHHSA
jgi:hypothetical protein